MFRTESRGTEICRRNASRQMSFGWSENLVLQIIFLISTLLRLESSGHLQTIFSLQAISRIYCRQRKLDEQIAIPHRKRPTSAAKYAPRSSLTSLERDDAKIPPKYSAATSLSQKYASLRMFFNTRGGTCPAWFILLPSFLSADRKTRCMLETPFSVNVFNPSPR